MAFNITEIDGVKVDASTGRFPVDIVYSPHELSGAQHIGQLSNAQIPVSIMRLENHVSDPHTMTIDGRDVSVDGAKLDTIESGAEVNNLTDAQASSLTSGLHSSWHNHDTWYYRKSELQTAGSASIIWDNITNKPSSYPPSSHVHDDLYYLKSEITTLLSGKSDINHNHDTSYYTQTQLNAGQLDSRYYTESEVDTKIHAASIGVQGAVDTYTSLPSTNLVTGMIYIVKQTVDTHEEGFYQWNGSAWTFLVNNTGIETHNALSGLNVGDYQHLSQAQYTGLTGAADTTLHTHDGRYFTESEITTSYYTKTNLQTSGSASIAWGNLTGVPTTFVPAAHTQSTDTITSGTLPIVRGGTNNTSYTASKILVYDGSKFASSSYGVSDFSLSTHNHDTVYAAISHIHDDRYYTETETDSLLAAKANSSHTHDTIYYTKTLLDGGQLDSRYYTESEVITLLAGKSDTSHTHDTIYYTKTLLDGGQLDSRYYTESEVTTLLAGKSDTTHTHDSRYYTQAQITTYLAGKSDTTHNHDSAYYTKTNMQTSGGAQLHWDNITNKPTLGGNNWIEPVVYKYTGTALPTSGYSSGDKIIWNSDQKVYKYSGTAWAVYYTPAKNDTVMVSNDGDSKPAQYWFDGTSWIKIADPDYSDHGSLGGLGDDDHPQYLNTTRHTAITGNPHGTTFTNVISADATVSWTKAQLDTLLNGSDVSLHNHNTLYYTKTLANTTFAPISHTHDDRYYTEAEINAYGATITYATISTNDPNTDITAAELETLTNGSNADGLHTHSFSTANITLDSSYGTYGGGRVITVDNGPVEFAATGGFAPLSIPAVSYTPTQWLSGGQICFKNNELYYYDSTRGKWLSISELTFTASSSSNAVAGYLYVGSTQMNSVIGFNMPFDGTIVGVAYSNANASSSGRMFVANNGTNIATLYYSGLTSYDNAMNVNFAADDVLQLSSTAYSNGGKPNKPIVTLFVKKRI